MLILPAAMMALLESFRPVFHRSIWNKVRVLLVGAILAPDIVKVPRPLFHRLVNSLCYAAQSYKVELTKYEVWKARRELLTSDKDIKLLTKRVAANNNKNRQSGFPRTETNLEEQLPSDSFHEDNWNVETWWLTQSALSSLVERAWINSYRTQRKPTTKIPYVFCFSYLFNGELSAGQRLFEK